MYQIAFWALAALALARPGLAAEDPDALYAQRATLSKAVEAAAIWQAALDRNPSDFEAEWKRARAGYWIGGHETTQAARDAAYEAAMAAARKAIAAHPDKPEGHFWLAANMGGYAQDHGIRGGLKFRGDIRDELEKVLTLDKGFQQGSADRALGRWYFKVPRLFGGSNPLSEQHLKASLRYDPDGTASHFFLAELYLDTDRKSEARAELQKTIDARGYPEWKPEDDEFKERARKILRSLK